MGSQKTGHDWATFTHSLVVIQFLSHFQFFVTPWTVAGQVFLSFSVSLSFLRLMSVESVMPSQPFHPMSPHHALSLNLSQHQGLFQSISSSPQVAKVLEFQHQSFHWIFRVDFLQDWLVWSSCSPKDSQESSLAPHFESIYSSVFNLFYCPALTSVHDYWKSHEFVYTNLCWQSNVSAFQYAV